MMLLWMLLRFPVRPTGRGPPRCDGDQEALAPDAVPIPATRRPRAGRARTRRR